MGERTNREKERRYVLEYRRCFMLKRVRWNACELKGKSELAARVMLTRRGERRGGEFAFNHGQYITGDHLFGAQPKIVCGTASDQSGKENKPNYGREEKVSC